jgi:hypothetical protein
MTTNQENDMSTLTDKFTADDLEALRDGARGLLDLKAKSDKIAAVIREKQDEFNAPKFSASARAARLAAAAMGEAVAVEAPDPVDYESLRLTILGLEAERKDLEDQIVRARAMFRGQVREVMLKAAEELAKDYVAKGHELRDLWLELLTAHRAYTNGVDGFGQITPEGWLQFHVPGGETLEALKKSTTRSDFAGPAIATGKILQSRTEQYKLKSEIYQIIGMDIL